MNREEAILKLKVMQIDSECYIGERYDNESYFKLKRKNQEVVDYIKENLK